MERTINNTINFSEIKSEESSFRDISGFIFRYKGKIYRYVSNDYKENFDILINSGLYENLSSKNILLPFSIEKSFTVENCYQILKPEFIENISYPFEWCFSQLKDAALLTLETAKTALDHGMVLKDATCYNIQFVNGRPIFIDTLSFEKYEINKPWIAYRQFCQHFLSPLLLMKYKDIRLNSLLKNYIDGIPLEITDKLLGKHRYLPGIFMHIHLQALLSKNNQQTEKKRQLSFSKNDHYKILDSLQSLINNLQIKLTNRNWSDYYENKILSSSYLSNKEELVKRYILEAKSVTIYDFGANTGKFSRIAAEYAKYVISTDIDPECVELNYRQCKNEKNSSLLPLILDLTNPSSSIGWDCNERNSFFNRMSKDTILALALIHHLVITCNIPLHKLALFFSKYCTKLIIEFVPPNDPKVQILVKNKNYIYHEYSKEKFEESFSKYFCIERYDIIEGSDRILYYMRTKNGEHQN